MNIVLLYIPCSSHEEGEEIVRHCFDESLIGPATIIPVPHLLKQDSTIKDAQECVVIVKTLETHLSFVIEQLRKMNTQNVPCMVQVLGKSNGRYIQILENQLKSV